LTEKQGSQDRLVAHRDTRLMDQYGTYDRFVAFRAAVMQAIAIAWKDEAFRARLIESPVQAMKDRIGYQFPFNMELGVDVDNAKWRPTTVADWQVLRPNLLELVLPPAPAHAGDRVEALAAFNASHLTFFNNRPLESGDATQ
jgi:ribosomally synthesized peptide (two-chain TOMM family)